MRDLLRAYVGHVLPTDVVGADILTGHGPGASGARDGRVTQIGGKEVLGDVGQGVGHPGSPGDPVRALGATVVAARTRDRRATVGVADLGTAVEPRRLIAAAVGFVLPVPVAVGREDGVVALAGVLQGIHHARRQRRTVSLPASVILADLFQCRPQWREAAGWCGIQLAVEVGPLRPLVEISQRQETGVGGSVRRAADRRVADTEARGIDGAHHLAHGPLHGQQARAVVAVPVGVVGLLRNGQAGEDGPLGPVVASGTGRRDRVSGVVGGVVELRGVVARSCTGTGHWRRQVVQDAQVGRTARARVAVVACRREAGIRHGRARGGQGRRVDDTRVVEDAVDATEPKTEVAVIGVVGQVVVAHASRVVHDEHHVRSHCRCRLRGQWRARDVRGMSLHLEGHRQHDGAGHAVAARMLGCLGFHARPRLQFRVMSHRLKN